ncbi:MAG TPA: hypothetical protein VG225_04770 [Terracidiphilus sp.]|jgi:hypothetical protein|nr:hypothetical protein [Terracidiphilus sp.]
MRRRRLLVLLLIVLACSGLYLHDQTGFKPPVVLDLGPDPSFFYSPT